MTQIKPGKYCPLIKKDCIGLKCSWYTQIRGTNPNTGQPVDEWGCAITWMPILTIEVAQKENQTGAAVESFRNEVVRTNAENQQLYLDSIDKMEKGIIPTTVTPLSPVIQLLNSNDDKIESID